ncbi:transmembrane signal receptor [Lithospermum erythrorhizon]|uniref:Transmembrane signal receptor n=1 Tax=Lithospermum erythrorhizon TaxID=34254 RepID=A0AAV3Q6B7_LITER
MMENLLRAKGLWGIVERGIGEPVDNAALTENQRALLDEVRTKDHQVKHYLFQALDREVFEQILDRRSSKIIWESMKKKFGGNQKVKKTTCNALRRDFELLEMKKSESIDQYIARVTQVSNKLRGNGEVMPDSKIVAKIMRTLTERFNYICVSIEESTNMEEISVDELQSTLTMHEQKFKRFQKEEDDQILKVEDKFGSRSRGKGRNTFEIDQAFKVEDRFGSSSRGRDRNAFGRSRGGGRQPFNKSAIECFKCHKFGHFQYECPLWNKEAHYTTCEEEDDILLMAQADQYGEEKDEVWCLDSGCSNHMCRSEDLFSVLDKTFKHSVKLGNNTKLIVAGKGIVKLRLNNVLYAVGEVYFVPELKNNLLSVGQLQEKGLTIMFKEGKCSVTHPKRGEILQTNMKTNRMFKIISEVQDYGETEEHCLQTTTKDITTLWHERLGHLNYNSLHNLKNKKMVHGLPEFKSDNLTCNSCVNGKQTRSGFPKEATWRASKPLELIHSDLCGPITPMSSSGKRYFLTFIDDFSRKCWIYVLENKSDAFTHFKYFKSMVENDANAKIKCLRTDRGGEFNSAEFDEYCKTNGIKRHLTTAYTPQQNGVAERKNRTLMNMVRSMMSGKNMPKKFWPEAVNWSCYVLNRCPTSSVEGMTPQEAWSGNKPSVEHLRIWGCLAHVHVPKPGRVKLDDRSKTCIFLGLNEGTKGYRLFDVQTERVVISRDVLFEEDKQWNWNEQQAETGKTTSGWSNIDDTILEESPIDHDDEPVDDQDNEAPAQVVDQNADQLDANEGSPVQGRATTRQGRAIRQPRWMGDYVTGEEVSDDEVNIVLGSNVEDPLYFEEANLEEKWRKAMQSEIESIERNNTWSLTTLPQGSKKIGVKWIYKTKTDEAGNITKHKARLVAKGYSQREGVDYTEVFAPVAKMDTVRMILSIAAHKNWKIYQLDVKSAFLQGEIEEEVYVSQPPGFEVIGKEDHVYKLHKALYGLKQAPRAWFSKIEAHFMKTGFKNSDNEQTLFTKRSETGSIIIVSMYVDDLIYTGNDYKMMMMFKESMVKVFEMTDLGNMNYFLGIEVRQTQAGIFIGQKKYAEEILKRFAMDDCNSVLCPMLPGTTFDKDIGGRQIDETYYKQIVGSLMYLTNTRPDMTFAVSILSRFMSKPTELHLQLAKRVLRYLKGTTDYGIYYQRDKNAGLLAYTDSDYAGDKYDRKSTSGYAFLISNGAVAWSSKKQPIVALSTTEAEFIAAAVCACQGIWMKKILRELDHSPGSCIHIKCDNSSTIKLSKNPVLHGRSKHIDIRFHFLRNLTKEGKIALEFCGTTDQVADILTKPLKNDSFMKLRSVLGVRSSTEIS